MPFLSRLLLLALLLGFLFNSKSLVAQTIYPINTNIFIFDCSGRLVDDGGINGNHAPTGQQEVTICSTSGNSGQTHIRLLFSDTDFSGTLFFYNSDLEDPATLIFEANGGDFPQGFIVEATAANSSGCLTVVFVPNGVGAGFNALIECVRACHPVRSTLASSDPEIMPVDTGYIDICPGQAVTFIGAGIYPESGIIYAQSDATSTFEWNFDDGTTATGPGVSHIFQNPGGYTVQLTITDAAGCKNINQINQRVRVAPFPRFPLQTAIPDVVCANDTISLTASIETNPNDSSSLFVFSEEQSFQVGQTLADTTFLPDGNGTEYTTSLEFSNFQTGAVLTNINDFLGVCLNIEHSYIGDLDISLECPNGTSVSLLTYPNGMGGIYFGEPIDFDNTLAPGVGYDYCWTPSATNTLRQAADVLGIGGGESMPSGDFSPIQSFNSFLGCPLNGEWTIRVRDNLLSDNGYIFSWGINFAERLFPNLETFRVQVVDGSWIDDGSLLYHSADSVASIPSLAGQSAFVYQVTDEFGCQSDTTITVSVLPFSAPECYNCQPMLDLSNQDLSGCAGDTPQTSLASRTSLDTVIAWGAFPIADFGFSTHPNQANAFRSTIAVNNMRPATITDAESQILTVCVNIETRFTDEVSLFLEAPNGQRLELSTGNGNTMNFTQTCFSPAATTPITAAASPFTGTFQPEGNWNVLNGSALNGNWTLVAWDNAGPTTLGRFLNWSIEFRHENDLTYSWMPAAGLSCTDCPNPSITGTTAQVYTVTVTDEYGCTETGTVNFEPSSLSVSYDLTTLAPSCTGDADGEVRVVLADTSDVSILWNTGDTTFTITGLAAGTYTFELNADGCTGGEAVILSVPNPIELALVRIDSVSCPSGSDGRIEVEASGGTGAIAYSWDDPNLQVLSEAVFLTAGTYRVTAEDSNGCSTFQDFTVPEPAPITINLSPTDVACRGQSTGSITAISNGGNGGYVYSWDNGSQEAATNNLAAGDYTLTVTDRKGCQQIITQSITEPAEGISFTSQQDQQGCAGQSLNIATVNPSGGQPPYAFSWPNGQTTATATNLAAGTLVVTISDASGCDLDVSLDLQDLAPITFNLIATPPSCNGSTNGAMGFNQLSGGAANNDSEYTFLWSSGATGFVANNLVGGVIYSLTVTDPQGCTGERQRLLEEPAPIQVVTASVAPSCFGFTNGQISIEGISGPNPGNYVIQWGANTGNSSSEVVDNLGAGLYSVRITDSQGCETTEDIVLNNPTQLIGQLNKIDATCFGDTNGSVLATAQGGTGSYTYNWSNGSTQPSLNNLPAGNYTLTITDANNCEFISSSEIVEPPQITASATATDVICFGDATGRINILGSGGRPPFTYSIDNSGFSRNSEFIGLVAGNYTASVRDVGGCTTSIPVDVADGPLFRVDLGPDSTIIFGDSLFLIASYQGAVGTPSFTWRGSYDGTLLCREDSTGREATTVVFCQRPNAKPDYEIDYTLQLIDENGCEAEDRVRIRVQKIRVVAVPAGFTPNGDGQNDLLLVHGRPGTNIRNFQVFDRWGELVYQDGGFQVNDTNRGWDGNYKNQALNAGNYVWQLEVIYEDGSSEVLSGSTTLLR